MLLLLFLSRLENMMNVWLMMPGQQKLYVKLLIEDKGKSTAAQIRNALVGNARIWLHSCCKPCKTWACRCQAARAISVYAPC